MLNKIKNKLKSAIRKKTKNKVNEKASPKKRASKKHAIKRPRKIKDPEAKLEAKRYDNPVASRTLILKTIKQAGMMTQKIEEVDYSADSITGRFE